MVRLTDRPDMTLDVYRGRETTIQQQQQFSCHFMSKMIIHCSLSVYRVYLIVFKILNRIGFNDIPQAEWIALISIYFIQG